jgi:CheY-like chemotaxis protein
MLDDDEAIRSLSHALFEYFQCIRFETIGSAKEADALLAKEYFHLFFCDLGIIDMQGDQYFLLKKYRRKLPIIILSGRASMEESAFSMSKGALWVFDKPILFDRAFFQTILDRFLLRSLFLHGADQCWHTRYAEAIEALFTSKPVSVEEWARGMNINERYLRKICECCPLPLLHMIHVFHLLDLSQECGKSFVLSRKSCDPSSCRASSNCRKLIEFYYLNKSSIDRFLRIGNQFRLVTME